MSEEERNKQFGTLLKQYQDEIDRLTKRSKFAENSFLEMYRILANAPDPVLAISNAMVKMF